MKFKINKHISMILMLSFLALVFAGTAAYYSVYGLSKLFYAGISTIIFFSALELGKLVLVSYLYQYWKIGVKFLKKYFISAVIIISLLTSLGVYSFLLNSHQKTSNKIEIRDNQIKLIENKKTYFLSDIERYQNQIKAKNERITTLTNTRKQQETRLDTLYNRKMVGIAKRTEDIVTNASNEIISKDKEISDIMNKINVLNDSVQSCDMKIIELKNSDISVEIGTFEQLSEITGISIESLVKILGLLIIFVFDPLAVGLVIAANDTWTIYIGEKRKKKEDEKIEVEEDDNIIGNTHRIIPLPKKSEIIEEIQEEKIEKESNWRFNTFEESKPISIELDATICDYTNLEIQEELPIETISEETTTEEEIPIVEEEIINNEKNQEELPIEKDENFIEEDQDLQEIKPKLYKTIIKRIGHRMFRTQKIEINQENK